MTDGMKDNKAVISIGKISVIGFIVLFVFYSDTIFTIKNQISSQIHDRDRSSKVKRLLNKKNSDVFEDIGAQ